VARQSHRASGRTAMAAGDDMHEPAPPTDPDSALTFSMEGYQGPPPAALIPRYVAPGWHSAQGLNKFQAEVGGPLAPGDRGVRLIEPAEEASDAAIAYFDVSAPSERPDASPQAADMHWVVDLHHIFGSEELSMAAPAVASRAPAPYLGLGPNDPLAVEGTLVRLHTPNGVLELPVRVIPGLPDNVAGLPVGLPDLPAAGCLALPARMIIEPDNH
jgi:NADH-quinone oxidoreductase subunit G